MGTPYHRTTAFVLGMISFTIVLVFFFYLKPSLARPWYTAFIVITLCFTEYLLGIFIHRLLFNPLAQYPGPRLAAFTDLWSVYRIMNGDRHLELHRQHKIHGKFVRYGPNRISVNSAQASRDLHHPNANVSLSDTYGSFKRFFGSEASMTTLDDKLHGFRRRINAAALRPEAVKLMVSRIVPHVNHLMELIEGAIGTANAVGSDPDGWSAPKNVEHLLKYCIADIMADMTFSYHWDTQSQPTYRHFVNGSPKGVAGIHLTGHMQWIFRWGLHRLLFGRLVRGIAELKQASDLLADTRAGRGMDNGRKGSDIWEAMLRARDPTTGARYTKEALGSEAGLLIVAGTDTMVTATASTVFYLLQNPSKLARVVHEVRTTFPGNSVRDSLIESSFAKLSHLTYLNACINEAMRLSPPVPSHLPRSARKGGIIIDAEFFPEGTHLGIPHYSLHRDERYFPRSSDYVPERWITQHSNGEDLLSYDMHDMNGPTLRDDGVQAKYGTGLANSYTPFGSGRYSCIGKHLAYQEMGYILACLLWLFDMRIAPGTTLGEGTGTGDEGRSRKAEYQLYDGFVCEQHGPIVQFKLREKFDPVAP